MADAALAGGAPRASAAQPSVQRRESGVAGAPGSVAGVLASSGAPLEPGLRSDMETRFGQDFSQVRVHSDAAAARSAGDVTAAAYTAGSHVVFGAGQFTPGNAAGQRLLAHELAHVVQQGGGAGATVQRKPLTLGDHKDDQQAGLLWESYRRSVTLAAFKSDSAELTPEHLASLKEYKERLFTLLDRYPDSFITVTGHTDATGTEKHNAKLGQDRADAVLKELTTGDNPVPARLVHAGSLGETGPDIKTAVGEPRNRRVTIMPTLRRGFGGPLLRPPTESGVPFDGTINVDPNSKKGPPYRTDRPLDTTPIPEVDPVPEVLRPEKPTESDRPVLPPPKPSDTPDERSGKFPKKWKF